MEEPASLQIEVPVRQDDPDAEPNVEILDVEVLGPNHYRLSYSPGLVEGVATGDEFELAPDDPLGYRVLKRSGNLCIWFFFLEKDRNRGPDGDRVRAAVERIGGVCDGGMSFVLVFTIPLKVGFPTIDQLFESLVKDYEGSCWQYGNVYDPIDGQTPMNWWES